MSIPSSLQPLSSAAVEVLGQLFTRGPIWDGNISSKSGRGELVDRGLAFHAHGWSSLTPDGVRTAVEWPQDTLKDRYDKSWVLKLRDS